MPKTNNNLVTKTYLDKKLDQFGKELKTELKEEIKEDIGSFKEDMKNELYEIKDEIVGEIKELREEFDAHRFSHDRIDETLEEHNQRIIKLEPKS